LRRCRELKAGGNNGSGSQESLGTGGNQSTAGRPPLPQRCSSLERPVVPPPTAKTKPEKVNKKNSLLLQQQKQKQQTEENNQPASSILPDFHQAAPDMSTCVCVPSLLYTTPSRGGGPGPATLFSSSFYARRAAPYVDPSSSAGAINI
jgi:hypothetical protein